MVADVYIVFGDLAMSSLSVLYTATSLLESSLPLEGVCGGIVSVDDWEHAEEFAQWVIIEMVDYEFIA